MKLPTIRQTLDKLFEFGFEEPRSIVEARCVAGLYLRWGGGVVRNDCSETYAETWFGRCERVAPCDQEYLF